MDELRKLEQDARADAAAVLATESLLLDARSAAIRAACRLRDLEYCREVGLLGEADAELAALRETAPALANSLLTAREQWRQAKQQAERSAGALCVAQNAHAVAAGGA